MRFAILTILTGAVLPSLASAQATLHTVSGSVANDTLGQVVDIIGNVNGDGFADFMAGAWRFDAPGGKTDAGIVRVYSGATGAILYNIYGDQIGDHMGFGSSAGFDINGDGRPDIAAAADEADTNGSNSGTLKAISGLDGSQLWAANGTAGDLFGWSSGAVGDVNGDGKSEVVSGSLQDDSTTQTNCGSAVVLNGANGSVLYTFFGDSANDQLGYSCYGAGDVNGDGVPDVIAGAPGDDNNGSGSGSARMYNGATGGVIRTFNGDSAGDSFGRSVSSAGDVDLDGFVDVIIGAQLDDNNGADSGMARIHSGKTFTILASINGLTAGERLGTSVRGAGDVNGDGYPDVVAGAPGFNSGAGAVRVFSGANFAPIFSYTGDSAADAMGTSVGAGGDIDNDGFADVVGGATGDDNNGSGSGSARAYSAVPVGITHFGTGTPGCSGVQLINGNGVPKINTPGFGIIGNRAPASSLNLLLAADGQLPAGGDQLGIFTTLYIDFFASTFVYGYDFVADAKGSCGAAVPLPNDNGLIGLTVVMQSVSAWPTNCGLGALQLSSSVAAVLTIQP